jgi:hypothetical protein
MQNPWLEKEAENCAQAAMVLSDRVDSLLRAANAAESEQERQKAILDAEFYSQQADGLALRAATLRRALDEVA